MAKRRRRARGAQRGNTNALKHGFYSRHLTDAQRADLADAQELDPAELADEIALVRARLAALIGDKNHGDRLDLVLAATRNIAHLAAIRHRLSPAAAENLGDAIARVITGAGALLQPAD